MNLILVRHGEIEENHKALYCGFTDSALTERGILQAKEMSEQLKEEKIDMIVSSNLKRAIKTAQMIHQHHKVKIIEDENLREMNFGLWEGLSYHTIKEKYPKELQKWQEDWIGYRVPKGESLAQMYERVVECIKRIRKEYKNQNILIVSHAGCIRAIISYLVGNGVEDYWKYKIENCRVTKIEIVDDFPVLTALNQ
ncbi:alpha-ribazole phosphatase [Anaerophilus nitritogenes]|uniref:alpha-ribazole phosphatase n=1 Tax=Anaerophilus nitritogenes TaxID=2498136 RepID=UPI00101D78E2|nr:alpha-ribazole phosphatase [Anaerophilus nitritogenes]